MLHRLLANGNISFVLALFASLAPCVILVACDTSLWVILHFKVSRVTPMNMQAAESIVMEPIENGFLELSDQELRTLVDTNARELLGISGRSSCADCMRETL